MKFKSAAAKKQYLDNQKTWNEMLKKYPVKAITPPTLKSVSRVTRETKQYPSHPCDFSPCVRKEVLEYTGDNMIGIGTLHKSNAVPIFSVEEAKDLSKMRR